MSKALKIIVTFLALTVLAACATAPSQTSTSSDSQLAMESLTSFLSDLHAGRYAQAAELYGGSYQVLEDMVPTLSFDDRPGLLEAACSTVGYACLKVKSVVLEEQISPNEFKFMVEFENEDGSLFVLGPCCGADETEMPPVSSFPFSVMVDDTGKYLVHTLPAYVP